MPFPSRSRERRTGADYYVLNNAGFLLETATVRIPDVSVVRKSSLASMERVRGALRGAPELAIEIVSEHEEAADLDLKIRQYLKAGAGAVWATYPKTRHVLVYRRSGETRDVGPEQFLEEPSCYRACGFRWRRFLRVWKV